MESGTLPSPVRPAAKLVEAPDLKESFLSHDTGLHAEEFPNLFALDDAEVKRDTRVNTNSFTG